ncbi:MAG: glycosyltransferase [Chitinophagaceae bacterium]|nr:glycosyltransferase [Chitinophagaceae bacterium]
MATLAAVDSALNQSYSNIEVIVSDNSFNDLTYNILYEYISKCRIIYLRNSTNIGPVFNWINCFNHSSGDLIKILFSDDLIDKDYLSITVPYFEKFPNATFISTSVIRRDKFSDTVLYHKEYSEILKYEDYLNELIFFKNVSYSPGNSIFRRQSFQIISSYDIELKDSILETGAGADVLIYLNAFSDYSKDIAIKIPFFLSIFNGHEESISLAKWETVAYCYNRVLLDQVSNSDLRLRQKNYLKAKILNIPLWKYTVIYFFKHIRGFYYLVVKR